MKRIKEIWDNILKKIKKSNVARLLKSRSIINELENKVKELEREKQILNDRIRKLELDLKNIDELENRISSMKLVIASSDKSIKNKMSEINQLKEEKVKLKTELFETKLQLGTANAQMEEYELQIKDLKSDRYLIKKVRSGRTPNTNKTKLSRPMSGNVVKFMKEKHEHE